MRQNALMPAETVQRRWTVASWLLAGVDDVEAVTHALEALSADAIALQSVHERDADTVAAALGMQMAWEVSHYPRSRLLLGSAVGLAVLSPHRITSSHSTVINDHRSLWSGKRRIAQLALVERHDQTGYTFVHALGTIAPTVPTTGFPAVRMVPVGVDEAAAAIVLPAEATTVSSSTETPIDGAPPLLATTFEMPWVRGDFPVI